MRKDRNFMYLVSEYIGIVSRTSFRILCDRKDSDYVTVQVFVMLWKTYGKKKINLSFRDWLIRYACILSRLRITRRRLMSLAGMAPDLFVSSKPKAEDYDDYVTTQAWEVFCRASTAMTPMQRIVFTLISLEGMRVSDVSEICSLFKFRVMLAHKRAVTKVRQELHKFGKDSDYDAYIGFMKKVSDDLEDIHMLEKMIFERTIVCSSASNVR
ncbi:MAG: sigma-70 family RNA polymerase sigma factor [Bacteroidales bacterium]|nr:sigma-70 family RNA polymerase sigma factor [Bacteroidales bacterium]MBQ6688110.1 sigma-70 family RNA polymerase sigma factor [Bacteroidales bacterium]